MRKLTLLILLVLLIMGCESVHNADVSEPEKVAAPQEVIKKENENLKLIIKALKSSVDIYDCEVSAIEQSEGINVRLSMTSGANGWIFADCVYSLTEATREALAYYEETLDEITVFLKIEIPGKDMEFFEWKSSDYDNGMLMDTTDKYIKNITLEELLDRYNYEPIVDITQGG